MRQINAIETERGRVFAKALELGQESRAVAGKARDAAVNFRHLGNRSQS